ncbi:hypothetical protein N7466_007232 [Penicillium verhagenii]|uniref:uncharacterized protein n=1 Tax=Penicillium verhagenii TaxID=1562060 RepID=UPI002544D93B|nr:uncharacterized protein N7466_007232 [Penicillium verhagenii]KAJ5928276.1 hypothetical protein N7466_007232 [Penicillium verhagenii]
MPGKNPSMDGKVSLGVHDLDVVKRSDEAQHALRKFIHKKHTFSEEEKSTLDFNSVEAFEDYWGLTWKAKEKFGAAHNSEVRSEIQSFVSSACGIMKSLDPIVALVKDLGAPYGSMAIGTISFVFTIINRRAQAENLISRTLLEIKDRVPGLNLYRHIYSDEHELDQGLQSKIVDAYDCFMGFCIEATKYYTKRGFRRSIDAMCGSMALEEESRKVQRAMVEVRHSSEELLNKNVDIIKQLSKELQEGRNNDALSKIQSLLNLETYSAESEQKLLKIYQDEIKHHFEFNWQPIFERMQGQAVEAFQQGQEFQGWQNSEQSSILILVGYNNESIYNDEMCWMSPAALQTIDDMIKDRQKDPFAFYLFGQRSENRFPQVLSSIIIQLLRQNRQSLQNQVQYDELYAAVQRFHELPYSQYSTQEDLVHNEEALRKVALRALDMFDSRRTVWIILDRVDRGKHARREANHRKMLIKSMVRLVEEAKVKVKVLAVVNGWDWDAEKESDDFGQIKKSSVVVHPVHQLVKEF